MSIVVTGAYGQLGGELCRQLGPDATPLDIDALDLTNGPAVVERMLAIRPEAIVNCAAYTQVDRAETEPEECRAVNAAAVERLAGVCGELDCPLVQISTDYVFGGPRPSRRPWREDEPTDPQGIYAQTKREGERAAARHPKHLILRTCGLYARADDPKAVNFVKTMLRLGAARSELRVVDDQCCTPTYVPHLARAILFLLGRGLSQFSRSENGTVPFTGADAQTILWGTYHVTNVGEATWREFAVEIFRLAKMSVTVHPISTAEYGAAAARPSYSVLDTTAYHRLGGPAMPHWKEALAEYFS
jgi:dTDP-4-dehydrorhamnose reductase